MPERTIPEEHAIGVEEFTARYLLAKQPVILRSAIAHWPAVSRWSPAYLKAVANEARFQVLSKTDYGDGGSKRLAEVSEEVELGTIVDMMELDDAPDVSYVRQATSWTRNPTLLGDILDLECGKPHIEKTDGNLWIGPRGTVAQLHWDPAHNLFAQIRGEKRWVLIPPWESHLTCPNVFRISDVARHRGLREVSPSFREKLEQLATSGQRIADIVNDLSRAELTALYDWLSEYNNSDVHLDDPDLTTAPQFSETTRYEGTLRAGDVIFVPQEWRHHVRSLSPSISMNWFFGRELHDDAMKKNIREHFADPVDLPAGTNA